MSLSMMTSSRFVVDPRSKGEDLFHNSAIILWVGWVGAQMLSPFHPLGHVPSPPVTDQEQSNSHETSHNTYHRSTYSNGTSKVSISCNCALPTYQSSKLYLFGIWLSLCRYLAYVPLASITAESSQLFWLIWKLELYNRSKQILHLFAFVGTTVEYTLLAGKSKVKSQGLCVGIVRHTRFEHLWSALEPVLNWNFWPQTCAVLCSPPSGACSWFSKLN
jgi:hypothetical protein